MCLHCAGFLLMILPWNSSSNRHCSNIHSSNVNSCDNEYAWPKIIVNCSLLKVVKFQIKHQKRGFSAKIRNGRGGRRASKCYSAETGGSRSFGQVILIFSRIWELSNFLTISWMEVVIFTNKSVHSIFPPKADGRGGQGCISRRGEGWRKFPAAKFEKQVGKRTKETFLPMSHFLLDAGSPWGKESEDQARGPVKMQVILCLFVGQCKLNLVSILWKLNHFSHQLWNGHWARCEEEKGSASHLLSLDNDGNPTGQEGGEDGLCPPEVPQCGQVESRRQPAHPKQGISSKIC